MNRKKGISSIEVMIGVGILMLVLSSALVALQSISRSIVSTKVGFESDSAFRTVLNDFRSRVGKEMLNNKTGFDNPALTGVWYYEYDPKSANHFNSDKDVTTVNYNTARVKVMANVEPVTLNYTRRLTVTVEWVEAKKKKKRQKVYFLVRGREALIAHKLTGQIRDALTDVGVPDIEVETIGVDGKILRGYTDSSGMISLPGIKQSQTGSDLVPVTIRANQRPVHPLYYFRGPDPTVGPASSQVPTPLERWDSRVTYVTDIYVDPAQDIVNVEPSGNPLYVYPYGKIRIGVTEKDDAAGDGHEVPNYGVEVVYINVETRDYEPEDRIVWTKPNGEITVHVIPGHYYLYPLGSMTVDPQARLIKAPDNRDWDTGDSLPFPMTSNTGHVYAGVANPAYSWGPDYLRRRAADPHLDTLGTHYRIMMRVLPGSTYDSSDLTAHPPDAWHPHYESDDPKGGAGINAARHTAPVPLLDPEMYSTHDPRNSWFQVMAMGHVSGNLIEGDWNGTRFVDGSDISMDLTVVGHNDPYRFHLPEFSIGEFTYYTGGVGTKAVDDTPVNNAQGSNSWLSRIHTLGILKENEDSRYAGFWGATADAGNSGEFTFYNFAMPIMGVFDDYYHPLVPGGRDQFGDRGWGKILPYKYTHYAPVFILSETNAGTPNTSVAQTFVGYLGEDGGAELDYEQVYTVIPSRTVWRDFIPSEGETFNHHLTGFEDWGDPGVYDTAFGDRDPENTVGWDFMFYGGETTNNFPYDIHVLKLSDLSNISGNIVDSTVGGVIAAGPDYGTVETWAIGTEGCDETTQICNANDPHYLDLTYRAPVSNTLAWDFSSPTSGAFRVLPSIPQYTSDPSTAFMGDAQAANGNARLVRYHLLLNSIPPPMPHYGLIRVYSKIEDPADPLHPTKKGVAKRTYLSPPAALRFDANGGPAWTDAALADLQNVGNNVYAFAFNSNLDVLEETEFRGSTWTVVRPDQNWNTASITITTSTTKRLPTFVKLAGSMATDYTDFNFPLSTDLGNQFTQCIPGFDCNGTYDANLTAPVANRYELRLGLIEIYDRQTAAAINVTFTFDDPKNPIPAANIKFRVLPTSIEYRKLKGNNWDWRTQYYYTTDANGQATVTTNLDFDSISGANLRVWIPAQGEIAMQSFYTEAYDGYIWDLIVTLKRVTINNENQKGTF